MNKKIKEIIEALEFMCKTGDVSKIALESLKNGLEELDEQLILSGVSHRRELLLFMEHLSTYHGIDEVIDCTKHQHIIEQYKK